MQQYGKVYSVSTRHAGADILDHSVSGGVLRLLVGDAAPFDEDGGHLTLRGVQFAYDGVDFDVEFEVDAVRVDFTDPTPEQVEAVALLEEDDRAAVVPAAPEVVALVSIAAGEDALVARVDHSLVAMLPDGVRDDEEAETVRLESEGSGWVIADVIGRPGNYTHGDPYGRAVEIAEDGITAYATDPDGNRLVVWSISSTGDDSFILRDATGRITASIDSTGRITSREGLFREGLTVGGTPLIDPDMELLGESTTWLGSLPHGLIARQVFNQTSPTRPTNAEWGYAKIGFRAKAGRCYRISGTVTVTNGTPDGITRVRFRYTEDGSDPTISSPQISRYHSSHPAYSGDAYVLMPIQGFIETASDSDVNVLLTYQGRGTATPSVINADLNVEDIGPIGVIGGTGEYSEGGASAPPTPPPPTVKTYTSVWRATASDVYTGSGSKITDPTPDLVQGYVSAASFHGHRRSATVFGGGAASGETGKTMNAALDGATVTKAEVFLYFNHWYFGAGGTARIGKLGWASTPSTLTDGYITSQGSTVSSADWPHGAGRWVRVPTSWFSDSNRGITIGGGSSTNGLYFGRANNHTAPNSSKPAVRLTYKR